MSFNQVNPHQQPRMATNTSRRQFLRNTLVIAAGSLVSSYSLSAIANSAVIGSDPLVAFIQVTQTITEHKQLDTTLAAHFFKAMASTDQQFSAKLHQLQQLITTPISAENFRQRALSHGLGNFLQQIIVAWYTGTVGEDYQGTLVAYKKALMYGTVSDGLIVPTYCGNGPLWWTEPVPAVINPEFIDQL